MAYGLISKTKDPKGVITRLVVSLLLSALEERQGNAFPTEQKKRRTCPGVQGFHVRAPEAL